MLETALMVSKDQQCQWCQWVECIWYVLLCSVYIVEGCTGIGMTGTTQILRKSCKDGSRCCRSLSEMEMCVMGLLQGHERNAEFKTHFTATLLLLWQKESVGNFPFPWQCKTTHQLRYLAIINDTHSLNANWHMRTSSDGRNFCGWGWAWVCVPCRSLFVIYDYHVYLAQFLIMHHLRMNQDLTLTSNNHEESVMIRQF